MPQPIRTLLAAGVAALAACSGGPAHRGAMAVSAGEQPAPGVLQDASVDRDTARVRAATAAFRSLDSAVAAGYPRSVTSCLSHPGVGAMGFHHVKPELVDDLVEVERPEILLYSRGPGGEYVLNGVEYVVPYSVRPPDSTPPTVMGQRLKRSDPLRIWYLHAWVWKDNPAGLFADWNPEVEC